MTNPVQEYYDTFGSVYEQVWNEQIHIGLFDKPNKTLDDACRDMTVMLAEASGLQRGDALLDIGCGQGGTDRLMVKMFAVYVTGVDLSPVQIAKATQRTAQEYLDIPYFVGSMEKMPFPDQSFDLIWCQESFSYSPDRAATLQEFRRILRPAGQLFIEDIVLLKPEAREEVGTQFGGRANVESTLTAEELEKMVGAAGFTLRKKLDLSSNVAPTYQAVNARIDANRERLKTSIPSEYKKALADNFGFPASQKLAEDGKIGDMAFWFN